MVWAFFGFSVLSFSLNVNVKHEANKAVLIEKIFSFKKVNVTFAIQENIKIQDILMLFVMYLSDTVVWTPRCSRPEPRSRIGQALIFTKKIREIVFTKKCDTHK